MKILLVDDDEMFTSLLKANLTEQRYIVDTATNGIDGWDFVEAQNYDLIVLDVMLAKLDGISFCRRLRARRAFLRFPPGTLTRGCVQILFYWICLAIMLHQMD